jgi:hypothetical protein
MLHPFNIYKLKVTNFIVKTKKYELPTLFLVKRSV